MEFVDGLWVKKAPNPASITDAVSKKTSSLESHWDCPECGQKNLRKRLKCSKCATARPGEASAPPPKTAKSIVDPPQDREMSDFARRQAALKSDAWNGLGPPGRGGTNQHTGAGSRKDWQCPGCNTVNAAARAACGICGERRVQGGQVAGTAALGKQKTERELAWERRFEEEGSPGGEGASVSPPDEQSDAGRGGAVEDEADGRPVEGEAKANDEDFSGGASALPPSKEQTGVEDPPASKPKLSAWSQEDPPKRKPTVYLPKKALAKVIDHKEAWRKHEEKRLRLDDAQEGLVHMNRKSKEERVEIEEFRHKRRQDMKRAMGDGAAPVSGKAGSTEGVDDVDVDEFGRKRRKVAPAAPPPAACASEEEEEEEEFHF